MNRLARREKLAIRVTLGIVLLAIAITIASFVFPDTVLKPIGKALVIMTVGAGTYLIGLGQAEVIMRESLTEIEDAGFWASPSAKRCLCIPEESWKAAKHKE